MCGISGISYFGSSGEASPRNETRTVLARLNQAQVHRGPDDEGIGLPAMAAGLDQNTQDSPKI